MTEDKAAPDTLGPRPELDLAALRANMEALQMAGLKEVGWWVDTVLSLLDRIEELQRQMDGARDRAVKLEAAWLEDQPVDNQIEDLRRVLSGEEPHHERSHR